MTFDAACRPLILNASKVILAPASSAYQHSIKEVLSNPGLANQIKVLNLLLLLLFKIWLFKVSMGHRLDLCETISDWRIYK